MTYPVQILTDKIKKHQKAIDELRAITEVEFNAEQIFIDNDIENHLLNINQLQEAIKKLL